mmetsp:Transcript_56863/g.165096  ORF Transcript_56863/g.165096 Transcript_56863/m.165096 type:complete len:236 (+) Transcript_56863:331-1038(+)
MKPYPCTSLVIFNVPQYSRSGGTNFFMRPLPESLRVDGRRLSAAAASSTAGQMLTAGCSKPGGASNKPGGGEAAAIATTDIASAKRAGASSSPGTWGRQSSSDKTGRPIGGGVTGANSSEHGDLGALDSSECGDLVDMRGEKVCEDRGESMKPADADCVGVEESGERVDFVAASTEGVVALGPWAVSARLAMRAAKSRSQTESSSPSESESSESKTSRFKRQVADAIAVCTAQEP